MGDDELSSMSSLSSKKKKEISVPEIAQKADSLSDISSMSSSSKPKSTKTDKGKAKAKAKAKPKGPRQPKASKKLELSRGAPRKLSMGEAFALRLGNNRKLTLSKGKADASENDPKAKKRPRGSTTGGLENVFAKAISGALKKTQTLATDAPKPKRPNKVTKKKVDIADKTDMAHAKAATRKFEGPAVYQVPMRLLDLKGGIDLNIALAEFAQRETVSSWYRPFEGLPSEEAFKSLVTSTYGPRAPPVEFHRNVMLIKTEAVETDEPRHINAKPRIASMDMFNRSNGTHQEQANVPFAFIKDTVPPRFHTSTLFPRLGLCQTYIPFEGKRNQPRTANNGIVVLTDAWLAGYMKSIRASCVAHVHWRTKTASEEVARSPSKMVDMLTTELLDRPLETTIGVQMQITANGKRTRCALINKICEVNGIKSVPRFRNTAKATLQTEGTTMNHSRTSDTRLIHPNTLSNFIASLAHIKIFKPTGHVYVDMTHISLCDAAGLPNTHHRTGRTAAFAPKINEPNARKRARQPTSRTQRHRSVIGKDVEPPSQQRLRNLMRDAITSAAQRISMTEAEIAEKARQEQKQKMEAAAQKQKRASATALSRIATQLGKDKKKKAGSSSLALLSQFAKKK